MEAFKKRFLLMKKRKNTKKNLKIMKVNKILLKQIGIWSDLNKRRCEKIMFLITMLIVSSLLIPELIYFFKTSEKISDLTQTVGILISLISLQMKHFLLFIKKGKYKSLLKKLQKECELLTLFDELISLKLSQNKQFTI